MSTSQHTYMRTALDLAQEAYTHAEVPIGCVFLHTPTNTILSTSRNKTNETLNATSHAEINCISDIIQKYEEGKEMLRGCVVYVTIEPCVMCASALRVVGIQKVYYGAGNEKFGGCGSVFRVNEDEGGRDLGVGYEAEGGYYKEEAIMILRKFYLRENDHAPVPKKKTNRTLKTEI